MQKSHQINQRKHNILQNIRDNIPIILFLNILLLSLKNTKTKKQEEEPARLDKRIVIHDSPKPKRKWSTPEILVIIIVILLLIILPLLVYSSGCLESTTYYNRRYV